MWLLELMKTCFVWLTFLVFMQPLSVTGQGQRIMPGAWQTEKYFLLLEGKRVAVAGNHTATIRDTHLVDSLLAASFNVVKVFSPEHGFRGHAAAGEHVESGVDLETGLPIISLYGSNRRPAAEQLQDIDIIVFDIQDVGIRFYTYISTMTYIMEEAAKQGVPMLILDRPNPTGHYIDGPILEPEFSSFVGLHTIPIVHGMTIGEYALMVNGEGWLQDGMTCDLKVIPVENYTHSTTYELPIPPSPNLPNMHAIYLYSSLCLFEGTDISLGRGTSKPFQVYGHPDFSQDHFQYVFTPKSVTAAPNPPHLNAVCHGIDLSNMDIRQLMIKDQIDLDYIISAYHHFPDKENFFNSFFEKLAGTKQLSQQIIDGLTAEDIRASWQDGLNAFSKIRTKYLLYPDVD
jgi:uncharacterized protein YbbC (DUF1343 family)